MLQDEDLVSRAFFEIPESIDSESHFPFRFDDERKEHAESVYCRECVPDLADVHARGCALEPIKKLRRDTRYVGARTAQVDAIRRITSGRGHSFIVFHLLENGDSAHTHIAIEPADEKHRKLRANDIRELVSLLVKHFGPLEPHRC